MENVLHRKKVLFVCSGNKVQGISPIVKIQAGSIRKMNLDVDYYPVIGKGVWGYVKHLLPLRQTIRSGRYHVVHAHYSWCGILVALAAPAYSNTIVSLMGSFKKHTLKFYLAHFFSKYFWKDIIVKSEQMKKQVDLNNAHLIPNGVNLENYNQLNQREIIRQKLGFKPSKKYVVFISDPARPEKNFKLCQDAVNGQNDQDVILITVYNKTPREVAQYQIAADVFMLTSFNEGSPNVVKEAMAACCPIVSTPVGDVKYVIGQTEGCYVLNSFDKPEAIKTLRMALSYNRRTNGDKQILSLGLDAKSIANKIIKLYGFNNA